MKEVYRKSIQDLHVPIDLEQAICIMDNIFGNVYVTDGEGRLIFLNSICAEGLGLPREKMIGMNAQELLDAGITKRSTTLESLRDKKAVVGLAHRGDSAELFTNSVPILDDGDKVTMVVTYSQERTLLDTFIDRMEQERQQGVVYKQALEYLIGSDNKSHPIIANAPAMKQIMRLADVIATTDSTIVIEGESGTGKDVLARYIHQKSLRASEPFIPVNCAAIPRELMESEFFGYRKGAFTGANAEGKPGLFELADRGTLFLDEIGELPLELQTKLLRVLETGEVTRLGGIASKKTDVRLIAATNRDLRGLVRQKAFREDLFYRLWVLPVTVPPLRERPEDIEPLANMFLDVFNKKYTHKRRFSKHVLAAFQQYRWPGNIRELKNVVERMVITSASDLLTSTSISEIDLHIAPEEPGGAHPVRYNGTLREVLDRVEEEYIAFVMEQCDGKVSEAAQAMGIHRSLLYKKLRKKD